MPLRATWNDEDVFAFDFDPEEWEQFRAKTSSAPEHLTMPCCGNRACLRTSPLGLQHFYHYRRGDCGAESEESEQHLLLKRYIVEACREAGFEATTEVGGDGWVADVLVDLGQNQDWAVAFEVQLSPQRWSETVARQEALRRSKVRGCWLMGPSLHASSECKKVPAFSLELPDDTGAIEHPRDVSVRISSGIPTMEVVDFVSALLHEKIQWVETVRNEVWRRFVFFPMKCWRCKEQAIAFYYKDFTRTFCECGKYSGGGAPALSSPVRPSHKGFDQSLLPWVTRYANKHELPVGAVKKRYSKTLERSYLSQGCPHCDALFGNHYLRTACLEAGYQVDDGELDHVIEWKLGEETGERPHWCLS